MRPLRRLRQAWVQRQHPVALTLSVYGPQKKPIISLASSRGSMTIHAEDGGVDHNHARAEMFAQGIVGHTGIRFFDQRPAGLGKRIEAPAVNPPVWGWLGTTFTLLGSGAMGLRVLPPSACYAVMLVGSTIWFLKAFWRRDRPLYVLNLAFIAANIVGIFAWWEV